MTFAKMWPFLFLLLIPAIVILYLLKQKAVDLKVASLYLWKEAFKNNTATTPFQRFRNNILMYLQIATVITLVLAIASPYIKNLGSKKETAIILIDASASMQRRFDSDSSRFDTALSGASDYVSNMVKNPTISVVSITDIASVCVSNTNSKSEAIKAINNIEQTDLAGNMDSAINLIHALTNKDEKIDVVVFTDNAAAFDDTDIKVVDLTSSEGNAYLTLLNHSEGKNGLDVLTALQNDTNSTITTDINLYGDGKLLSVKEVKVESGKQQNVIFNDVAFSGDVLYAEINNDDALTKDNICYDVMDKKKANKVLIVSKQNVFLEKVVKACGDFEVSKSQDAEDYSEQGYSLYIYDGIFPEKLPKKGSVLLINCDDELVKAKSVSEGTLINVLDSDYTQYLSTYSFGVNAYKYYEVPSWGASIMKAGDKNVAYAGKYDGRGIAVLGFDLHNSQLPLEAEFPVLMLQLLNRLMETDYIADNVVTAGDDVIVNSSADGERVAVKMDGKDITSLNAGKAVFGETDYTGIYTITQKVSDKQESEKFAVNFPLAESKDIASNAEQKSEKISISDIKENYNIRWYVIVICVLLLMLEWVIYIRKI